jgi:hypothetical protein
MQETEEAKQTRLLSLEKGMRSLTKRKKVLSIAVERP